MRDVNRPTLIIEPVLLGDVNRDGSVDLLDVGPFVDLLLTGDVQAEADINQDGAVTMLDVGPFVDLLNGSCNFPVWSTDTRQISKNPVPKGQRQKDRQIGCYIATQLSITGPASVYLLDCWFFGYGRHQE